MVLVIAVQWISSIQRRNTVNMHYRQMLRLLPPALLSPLLLGGALGWLFDAAAVGAAVGLAIALGWQLWQRARLYQK